jgi:hypothetical protein
LGEALDLSSEKQTTSSRQLEQGNPDGLVDKTASLLLTNAF